jgi:hypothetical protein
MPEVTGFRQNPQRAGQKGASNTLKKPGYNLPGFFKVFDAQRITQ